MRRDSGWEGEREAAAADEGTSRGSMFPLDPIVRQPSFISECRQTRFYNSILVALVGGGKRAWMRVQVRGLKIAGSRTRSALKIIR